MSDELTQAYRIIVQNTASQVSSRLHITTMKLTNFWEYLRNGDPIVVNMLRDGIPLYDTGFFEPVQQLLFDGRIRPTKESVYNYYARAPLTINNADWHVTQAGIDLYWAVIDAAHAALMHAGCIAPTPSHVSDLLDSTFVKKGMLHKKHIRTISVLYELNKDILHKKRATLSGKEYDELRRQASEFIDAVRKIISKQ